MPTFEPYMIFNGNCREAMEFYRTTFGGEMQMMMTHGESPMKDQCPEAFRDQIMHACLAIDGRNLLASDNMPGQPSSACRGWWLVVQSRSNKEHPC